MTAEITYLEVAAMVSEMVIAWSSRQERLCTSQELKRLRSRIDEYLGRADQMVGAGEELIRAVRVLEELRQR